MVARLTDVAKEFAATLTTRQTSQHHSDPLVHSLVAYSDFHVFVRSSIEHIQKFTQGLERLHSELIDRVIKLCPENDSREKPLKNLRQLMPQFLKLNNSAMSLLRSADNSASVTLLRLEQLAAQFKARDALQKTELIHTKKLEQLRKKRIQFSTTQSTMDKIAEEEEKRQKVVQKRHELSATIRHNATEELDKQVAECTDSLSLIIDASIQYFTDTFHKIEQVQYFLQQLHKFSNNKQSNEKNRFHIDASPIRKRCTLPLYVGFDDSDMKLSMSALSQWTPRLNMEESKKTYPTFPENSLTTNKIHPAEAACITSYTNKENNTYKQSRVNNLPIFPLDAEDTPSTSNITTVPQSQVKTTIPPSQQTPIAYLSAVNNLPVSMNSGYCEKEKIVHNKPLIPQKDDLITSSVQGNVTLNTNLRNSYPASVEPSSIFNKKQENKQLRIVPMFPDDEDEPYSSQLPMKKNDLELSSKKQYNLSSTPPIEDHFAPKLFSTKSINSRVSKNLPIPPKMHDTTQTVDVLLNPINHVDNTAVAQMSSSRNIQYNTLSQESFNRTSDVKTEFHLQHQHGSSSNSITSNLSNSVQNERGTYWDTFYKE